MPYELRGVGNTFIGSFESRLTALVIAREVLCADEAAPATVLLQELDDDRRVVREELVAARARFGGQGRPLPG